jgi:hypothetical protein
MSTIPTAPPTSMTFRCLQQTQVTWTLTSPTGAPVTGLTVSATLYVNRSRSNSSEPGTIADPNFSSLSMPETVLNTSGIYQGVVPAAFNPSPATTGFLVVITALNGATLVDTWTIPAVVIFPQNSTDLVEIDDVKSWLNIPSTNTDDDGLLQLLISSFSQYVLNRTGQQSFSTVNSYTDIYSGNNSYRLFLRNTPIQSVTSIIVGAWTVPQSTGLTTNGWYIDPDGKSVVLRSSASGYMTAPYSSYYTTWPGCFLRGQGNIQVTYTAGYNSVPYDLQEAVMEAVAINYSRKDWIDLASKALSPTGGGGSTRYRDWHLPPGIRIVLDYYSRRAIAY